MDSRYVRHMILKALYANHPGWMPDSLLLRSMDDLGVPLAQERLSSELIYLRDWPNDDRGYVELQSRFVPVSGGTIKESRLTPLGVNLIERLIPRDPMVMV